METNITARVFFYNMITEFLSNNTIRCSENRAVIL